MALMKKFQIALILATMTTLANGHIAAWAKGMYCLNGTTPGEDNGNNAAPVTPLFKLKKQDWWMHHIDKCDEFPPAPGDFLELPANGNFTVEFATNRAFTTLSNDGKKAGVFPGPLTGGTKSDRTEGEPGKFKVGQQGADHEVPGCIVDPNMHTQNETMASGTAFAISYTSDIKKVTPENLVVFTVLKHTPFRRLATYQVPNLPACPKGGCICTWGWIPNGCGEPNMYFFPYRCNVTGTPGTKPLALPARPPNWCDVQLPLTTTPSANNTKPGKGEVQTLGSCYKGSKQMLFWNQLEGDNIEVLDGELGERLGSPGYNEKVGYRNGAQTGIFALDSDNTSTPSAPSSSTSSSSAGTTNTRAGGAPATVTPSTAAASSSTSAPSVLPSSATTTSSATPSSVASLSLTTIRVVTEAPTTITSTAQPRSTTTSASSQVNTATGAHKHIAGEGAYLVVLVGIILGVISGI
ncbi:hypothetical protein V5O48_010788 [Marasmius crinis-equi]|uniref:Uncharacterized protein n=1 Tax=Marasmius crinis-equi TaxID=585013 RepID=A0ABR3F7U4_9AGAR